MSRGLYAPGSKIGFCQLKTHLHISSQGNGKKTNSGFSLIEVLLVVLVIGIICATGVSIYAGVTTDSQIRTINDQISSFFYACRHRAIMRKTPVTIIFSDKRLKIDQSSALELRLGEIEPIMGNELLNGLTVTPDGFFHKNNRTIKMIDLPVVLPGNKLHKLRIEL